MPKPSTVQAPAQLLAYLFATWPNEKKKQIRTWLKFQSVMVNDRPITQFDHPLYPGDIVSIRTDRFAAPRSVLACGITVHYEDADIIEAFLDARAADAASFDWTPPDSNTSYKWICPTWTRELFGFKRSKIDVTFNQVFEP